MNSQTLRRRKTKPVFIMQRDLPVHITTDLTKKSLGEDLMLEATQEGNEQEHIERLANVLTAKEVARCVHLYQPHLQHTHHHCGHREVARRIHH